MPYTMASPARALAGFLGGEERLEEALPGFRRHAGAVIADGEHAVRPRLHADVAVGVFAVQRGAWQSEWSQRAALAA